MEISQRLQYPNRSHPQSEGTIEYRRVLNAPIEIPEPLPPASIDYSFRPARKQAEKVLF
jgi:hypothetical protein